MSAETIVLAVNGGSDDLTDRLAAIVADIADPTDAEIVLTCSVNRSTRARGID